MKKKFIDISDKIDEFAKKLFLDIDTITKQLAVKPLIVGAFARDIILHYGHGMPVFRATTDYDIGIQLETWDVFRMLKEKLIDSKNFKETDTIHRLINDDELIVDLIPFGDISDIDDTYTWKDKNKTKFNVLGFENAFKTASIVRINANPIIEMKFASLEGQAVLKIISWDESNGSREKDAIDLVTFMISHIDAGNLERFFEENYDIATKKNQIKWEDSSARLLGRDISININKKTLIRINDILSRELGKDESKLVIDMLKSNIGNYEYNDYYSLVNSLYKGIQDIKSTK
ncbi:MAG: hypothetical protein GWP19_10945 [Planctomycetia bacterium]|nr:hypothetical protein [Planctomycetia bacterium]